MSGLFSIRLSENTKEKLSETANSMNTTPSDIVRSLIEEHLGTQRQRLNDVVSENQRLSKAIADAIKLRESSERLLEEVSV